MEEDIKPESIQAAKQLEKDGDTKAAFAMYQKLLRGAKSYLPILTRLMVLSRKLKLYKKELVYLDKIIKIHEQQYNKNVKISDKAKSISEKLNYSLGHTDKKGNPKNVPAEIDKLEKRKTNVLKKI